jgi:hypothetical protein
MGNEKLKKMKVERKTFLFPGGQSYTRNVDEAFYLPRIYAKWSLSLSVTYSASTEERPKEAVCSIENDVLLFLLKELFLPLFNSTCLRPSVPHMAQ